jgi:CspA family cold shock protein
MRYMNPIAGSPFVSMPAAERLPKYRRAPACIYPGRRADFIDTDRTALAERDRMLSSARRPRLRLGYLMPIGTVKFFNADKGYGFIAPEGGGNDAFVHISAVERAGMSTLQKDQRVSYELEQDRRGKTSAVNLESA